MTQSAIDRRPVAARPAVHIPSRSVSTHRAIPYHLDVRRGRVLVLLGLAGALYILDLVTKIAAVAMLEENEPVDVGGTGVSLRLIRNPGAAFGLGVDVTWLFTAITLLVVVAILRTASRLGSLPWALTLGLLLGGAVGNLTDRLARAPGFLHGHVIDFVEIPGWPIFNVADLSICLAGLLMVVLACRNVPIDGSPRSR